MKTQVKYTPEMENELRTIYLSVEDYDERRTLIDEYALKYNKTARMVIAKLNKMGIYKARPNVSKVTGEKPQTKEQIVTKISNVLDEGSLEGLEKAPKLVLLKLLRRLESDVDKEC